MFAQHLVLTTLPQPGQLQACGSQATEQSLLLSRLCRVQPRPSLCWHHGASMDSGNRQRSWPPWTVWPRRVKRAECELHLLRPGQPGVMRPVAYVKPVWACLASRVSSPEAAFPRTQLSQSHEPQAGKALRDQLPLLGLQRKPGPGRRGREGGRVVSLQLGSG